jgi:hypothetical protein
VRPRRQRCCGRSTEGERADAHGLQQNGGRILRKVAEAPEAPVRPEAAARKSESDPTRTRSRKIGVSTLRVSTAGTILGWTLPLVL